MAPIISPFQSARILSSVAGRRARRAQPRAARAADLRQLPLRVAGVATRSTRAAAGGGRSVLLEDRLAGEAEQRREQGALGPEGGVSSSAGSRRSNPLVRRRSRRRWRERKPPSAPVISRSRKSRVSRATRARLGAPARGLGVERARAARCRRASSRSAAPATRASVE